MFRRNLVPAWLAIVILSGMFLMGQESGCPWDSEVVNFPDPGLNEAVRYAIGKPQGPICSSDLVGLETLDARTSSITNISGLEHCTDLTWLNLTSNQISDIHLLAGLTGLTVLHLTDNPISDLSPLETLTGLTELCLVDCQVSDLSPLAGMTSLEYLSLWNNQVSDIGPLAGLTSMTHLMLTYNQISDLYPLVENPGLASGDYVDVVDNPLSATSCTVYIPELESRGVNVSHDCP